MEDIPEIKFLKFSFNGNYILLGSTDNQINLIDAFEGKKVRLSNPIIISFSCTNSLRVSMT
jgi:hypothetical protein